MKKNAALNINSRRLVYRLASVCEGQGFASPEPLLVGKLATKSIQANAIAVETSHCFTAGSSLAFSNSLSSSKITCSLSAMFRSLPDLWYAFFVHASDCVCEDQQFHVDGSECLFIRHEINLLKIANRLIDLRSGIAHNSVPKALVNRLAHTQRKD